MMILLVMPLCFSWGLQHAVLKSNRVGKAIADASSVWSVLDATQSLPLRGEERETWERDPVHVRKRQIATTSALRKLSRWLVGSGADDLRRSVVLDERFGRLARLASGSGGEIPERAEALRLLATLAQPGSGMELWKCEIEEGLARMAESSTMPADSVTSARWAAERFALFAESSASLDALRAAEYSLNLPFEVVPCALKECPSLEDVRRVLPLAAESVVTSSGAVVEERRHTAWLTDAEDIGGLAYSGKIMSPKPFPNAVKSLRDSLCRSLDTDELDYDCALVNLYPTGGAACKYHIDPEHGSQGDLKAYWARDQAVLSLGEVRRFAFRDTQGQHHHVFHLFHGDCVHMFGNCQEEYQHCVFKAEDDLTNRDPRLSFVFKRALLRPTGKQPRGHAGFTEIGNDHLKKRETRQPRPRRRPTKKRRRGS